MTEIEYYRLFLGLCADNPELFRATVQLIAKYFPTRNRVAAVREFRDLCREHAAGSGLDTIIGARTIVNVCFAEYLYGLNAISGLFVKPINETMPDGFGPVASAC